MVPTGFRSWSEADRSSFHGQEGIIEPSVGYLLIAIAITALNKNTMLKKPELAGTNRKSGASQ
jgi:hypothetical protein